jgi:uncharacterized membrane protein
MKKALILSAFILSCGVAQADNRAQLERKAINSAHRLAQTVLDEAEFMSRAELREVIRLTKKAKRIALGGGIDNGPVASAPLVFSVNFDGAAAIIEGNSVAQIMKNCRTKVESLKIGSIDDIQVTVMGGAKKSARTSGWWNSTANKCNVMTNLAIESAMASNKKVSSKQYVMYGFADGIGVIGEGNSLSELENSCRKNLSTLGSISIDDINVAINKGPKKSKRTSGWWNDANTICSTAVATAL